MVFSDFGLSHLVHCSISCNLAKGTVIATSMSSTLGDVPLDTSQCQQFLYSLDWRTKHALLVNPTFTTCFFVLFLRVFFRVDFCLVCVSVSFRQKLWED